MQWLLDHQTTLMALAGGSIISAGVASWWMKNKLQAQCQLLEQELELKSQLHQSESQQLKQSLVQSQQELDELDIERDKAAHELKQTHGKMMAMLEKLRHFESLRNEREQYARDLDVMREQKSELEASLREQEARHQQESKANQEKLQLLEQAEERLKQQFEQLANQLFETKTAKVDQQNRTSLEGLLSPSKSN
ncbi:DNA recombination protein RmuC [Vibrio astriarenae]|nr:DNA recombination protein RmuC [Vibrio sp. C7]